MIAQLAMDWQDWNPLMLCHVRNVQQIRLIFIAILSALLAMILEGCSAPVNQKCKLHLIIGRTLIRNRTKSFQAIAPRHIVALIKTDVCGMHHHCHHPLIYAQKIVIPRYLYVVDVQLGIRRYLALQIARNAAAITTNYYYSHFFIAMLYVLFLAHFNTNTETNFDTTQKELSYAKLFAKDDMEAIKIAILRPMVYLFQAISIITIQTGYTFYLQPLIDVFSMQFIIAEYGGNDGLCLTTHLTAIWKLLWYLFFPLAMLIIILTYYIVYEKLSAFQFKRFKPNFGSAFWHSILIMLGAFLDKFFKILACRRVDSDAIGTVHFYAGSVHCYGGEWVISLITVLLIIMFWFAIWRHLYKMDPKKRNSTKSVTRNLTQSYKPRFWWWEFLLITRRISLAFVITFDYLSESFARYILLSILIFYLTVHVKYSPFKHGRVNYFETFCLVLLILGLTCLGFELQHISPLFVAIILSLVVLIPFCLFVYFVVVLVKTYYKQTRKDEAGNFEWDENRLI
eukprot:517521_1